MYQIDKVHLKMVGYLLSIPKSFFFHIGVTTYIIMLTIVFKESLKWKIQRIHQDKFFALL